MKYWVLHFSLFLNSVVVLCIVDRDLFITVGFGNDSQNLSAGRV